MRYRKEFELDVIGGEGKLGEVEGGYIVFRLKCMSKESMLKK